MLSLRNKKQLKRKMKQRIRFFIDVKKKEIKLQLLRRLNLEKQDCLHYIPVDFTKGNLASALLESKYDSRQESFFSWMGVTQYLPLEALLLTLKTIIGLSSAGSEITTINQINYY